MADQIILDGRVKGNVVRFYLGPSQGIRSSNYKSSDLKIAPQWITKYEDVMFPFDWNVYDIRTTVPKVTIYDLISRKYPLIVVTGGSQVSYDDIIKSANLRFYIGDSLIAKNPFKLTITDIANIDYAHFLAFHAGKCKSLHAHGSCKFDVEVEGWSDGRLVVDFGIIKSEVKKVIELLDHKLLVFRDYVTVKRDKCVIKYKTVNGTHYLELPRNEVYIFDKDPTLENILQFIASLILQRLPSNVTKVTVTGREGLGGFASFTLERARLL